MADPAHRGDLVAIKCHMPVTVLHGKSYEVITFECAQVTSVSREGRVKAYRSIGHTMESKRTPAQCWIVSQEKVRVDEILQELERRRAHKFGSDAFRSLEDLVAFLQAYKVRPLPQAA